MNIEPSTNPPAWIVALEAELAGGFDPRVLSYRRAWTAAVEQCVKICDTYQEANAENDNVVLLLGQLSNKLKELK